jgi:hypothetical protein
VTYIALSHQTICGYMTVAAGSIEFEELPESTTSPHNYPLPMVY